MFFAGTDMFEGDGDAATFAANIKSVGSDGQVVVKVYATSGMTAKALYPLSFYYTTSGNCWFQPMIMSASNCGLPGIASGAIASGCVGWVTVRGKVTDASSPATVMFTGSIGHAVYWGGASGMGATSSAYIGAIHQIGVLMETSVTGTIACDIFLTGNPRAQSL